jgi:hypothetical protein
VRPTAKLGGFGLLTVAAVLFLAVAPGYATTAGAPASADRVSSTFPFPSSSSIVVASVGFIDDHQVGYFWSAARGDRVTQTFSGPRAVRRAILKVEVVTNVLANGAHVDWNLEVKGRVVGSFSVVEGFIGPITVDVTFPRIFGPNYKVTIRVTNEVPGGDGSVTLAYAGAYAHSITLRRLP